MPLFDFPSDSGDLIVTYDVVFPKTLNQEQQECKYKQNKIYSVQIGVLNVRNNN